MPGKTETGQVIGVGEKVTFPYATVIGTRKGFNVITTDPNSRSFQTTINFGDPKYPNGARVIDWGENHQPGTPIQIVPELAPNFFRRIFKF